jgi:hypothetical protein
MPAQIRTFAVTALALLLAEPVAAQDVRSGTSGLGLNPARLEVEIHPGGEKTASFRVESPPSDIPVQGRLMLSLTDWNIDGQANVSYLDPGLLPDSASPWIIFSPSAVNIRSGESHLVRVTVRVPETAAPGVYRSGIFIQERPPATPPSPGEHLLFFRFRYVFTLYVVVPPVAGKGELVDVRLVMERSGPAILYEMKNLGSRHIRPRVAWSLLDENRREITAARNRETTVLLPHASLNMRFPLAGPLVPGEYQLEALVDFNDGAAVQAVRRLVQLPAAPESTAAATARKR